MPPGLTQATDPNVGRSPASRPRRRTALLPTDSIILGERLRPVSEDESMARLHDSIADIGQHTPIIVRRVEGGAHQLVAGAHRLAAQKKRGAPEIECVILDDCSDEEARLIEISENLHRKELNALERDHLIAEWVRIMGARRISCQPDKKTRGRPRGGISEAARQAGVSVSDAHRAVRVDRLSTKAKDTAKAVGLDNDRSALLAAAGAQPEDQPGVLREIAAARANRSGSNTEGSGQDNKSIWLAAGRAWWSRAPAAWQQTFLSEVGQARSSSAKAEAEVLRAATSAASPNSGMVTRASAAIIHAFRRRDRLKISDLPGADRGTDYSSAIADLEAGGLIRRDGSELCWTGPR